MSEPDAAAAKALRRYLEKLQPEEREDLALKVERARQAEPGDADQLLILDELRAVFRARGERPKRFTNPTRQFFISTEPFLVDHPSVAKIRGLIRRSSLMPIWRWIERDLDPGQAAQYANAVTDALLGGNENVSRAIIHSFQRRVAREGARYLAEAAADPQKQRRLMLHLGAERVFEDLRDWLAIHRNVEVLQRFASRLPREIASLPREAADKIVVLLDEPPMRAAGVAPYALILLKRRLRLPCEIVMLPRWASGSDQIGAVKANRFGFALDLALSRLAGLNIRAAGLLKRGEYGQALKGVKEFAESTRLLRGALDLSTTHAFAQDVAAQRVAMSAQLGTELDMAPGRLRRLLAPPSAEILVAGARPNERECQEVRELAELLLVCRLHADELAMNERVQRLGRDVREIVDTGSLRLAEALRGAPPAEIEPRLAQFGVAIALVAKLVGVPQAAALARVAEAAMPAAPRQRSA